MSDETNWTTLCPHCGYESEDNAMCRSCGRLMDESLPVRSFPISEIFASSSAVRQKTNWNTWVGNDEVDLDERLRTHPSFAFNPGNIFYNNED